MNKSLELLKTVDAAKYLNVSRRTIDEWKKQGLLAHIQKGTRYVRFKRQDLDAFLESITQEVKPQ